MSPTAVARSIPGVSPARACAYGVIRRVFEQGAYADRALHAEARELDPRERAIMAGDDRTGVSIMRLTAGLDSGPVCLTGEQAITPQDTYGTLAERLEGLGGELLVRA